MEKLNITRTLIQSINEQDSGALDNFLGIKMIDDGKSSEGLDCFGFLFGKDADAETILTGLFTNYTTSLEPTPGAIVMYMDADLKRALHIGKVTEEKTVISKWGLEGAVFEHLPYMVPAIYGWNIAFFSEKT